MDVLTARSPSPSRARTVGDDILACAVLPGYLVLIEGRQVDGDMHGDNAEVAAIITRSWPSEDGLFWELSWIGAPLGRPDARQGVALYDRRGTVTVLSRDLIGERAA